MLKKYKHFLIGFLVGTLLFSLSPVFANGELNIIKNPFPILINGQVTEVEGYNINGYTFLKLADFGKAGLDVKFNETEKRIEITNIQDVIESNKNEEIINTEKGDSDMSEEMAVNNSTIEKDGYNLIVVNGIEYVSIEEIYEKYKDEYCFNPLDGSRPLARGITLIDNETNQILLRIPRRQIDMFNNKEYITSKYFVDTILPLITKEGN